MIEAAGGKGGQAMTLTPDRRTDFRPGEPPDQHVHRDRQPRHPIPFHQLQRGTYARIRNRRVNERPGKEVGLDDVVKGYDTGNEYVRTPAQEDRAEYERLCAIAAPDGGIYLSCED
ncbi:Ku protein [Streptomyces sp. NPDC054797]